MQVFVQPDARRPSRPPRYLSDLYDVEWVILEPLLSPAEKRGRTLKWPSAAT